VLRLQASESRDVTPNQKKHSDLTYAISLGCSFKEGRRLEL